MIQRYMSKIIRPGAAYFLFGIFTLVYVALTLWAPTDTDILTRYDLTSSEARNLRLTVTLPYIVIWFFAIFGFVRLKTYSHLIRKSSHGKSLSTIANGLFVLAVGLPLRAIGNRLVSLAEDLQPHLAATSTIIVNYIDIIAGLVAVGLIYTGSQRLMKTTTKSNNKTAPPYLVMIVLALIGTSYTYLTFTNPVRQFPAAEGGHAAYYLPDFLLLFTVVLPYLIIWYMGLHAAYFIRIYRKSVQGIIYKKALAYLAAGIVFVVLSRVAMRYMASLNTIVEAWTLQYLLAIIYCLLIFIAIGYGLIAKGAEKLKKIEEV